MGVLAVDRKFWRTHQRSRGRCPVFPETDAPERPSSTPRPPSSCRSCEFAAVPRNGAHVGCADAKWRELQLDQFLVDAAWDCRKGTRLGLSFCSCAGRLTSCMAMPGIEWRCTAQWFRPARWPICLAGCRAAEIHKLDRLSRPAAAHQHGGL